MNWDEEFDVVIVGSGAGGLWIPNNHVSKKQGYRSVIYTKMEPIK